MYRIAVFTEVSEMQYADIDIYKRTKKQAINEYWKHVRLAFHGETILCYNNNMMKDYEDLMPNVTVCKKRDWRYGTDDMGTSIGKEHRKQYLKYKYLGKVNE